MEGGEILRKGKRAFGRYVRKWEDNITTDLQETV
jgi:hypothetical protein